MYDRKKTLMLLLGSLVAWPAAAQYIPPATLHNLHMCGQVNCPLPSSGPPPGPPPGTILVAPPTRWHVERGFGVVAIGHQANKSVGSHSHLHYAKGNSLQEAEQNVRKECGSRQCHIIARISNACVAVSGAVSVDGNNRHTQRFYVAPLDAEASRMLAAGLGDTGLSRHNRFRDRVQAAAKATCQADSTRRGSCYDSPEVFCARDDMSPR